MELEILTDSLMLQWSSSKCLEQVMLSVSLFSGKKCKLLFSYNHMIRI